MKKLILYGDPYLKIHKLHKREDGGYQLPIDFTMVLDTAIKNNYSIELLDDRGFNYDFLNHLSRSGIKNIVWGDGIIQGKTLSGIEYIFETECFGSTIEPPLRRYLLKQKLENVHICLILTDGYNIYADALSHYMLRQGTTVVIYNYILGKWTAKGA